MTGTPTAPTLAAAYRHCRALHRRHGHTYYLATALLPAWKRRHVHALYGFTRHADEIVDNPRGDPAAALARFTAQFTAALHGTPSPHPVITAVRHTIATFALDPADFDQFLTSMARDLTTTRYDTYDDLLDYMSGSAAAVGTMMLPLLAPHDRAAAHEPARQLGFAFQLTNFIRDVGEDLDRGRIYLPTEDLHHFGVSDTELTQRRTTPRLRALLAFQIARARQHYRAAQPGIALLHPTTQPAVRAACTLYSGILDAIERSDYAVLQHRARVPWPRRVAVAATHAGRATLAQAHPTAR